VVSLRTNIITTDGERMSNIPYENMKNDVKC